MTSWNSVYDVLLNTVIPCLHTVIVPFFKRIACLRERDGPILPNLNLPSRDLNPHQVNLCGERDRSGGHEIWGTFVGAVVSLRVLRTSDFINDLDTQLLHNHSSLVIFDRRNPRQTAYYSRQGNRRPPVRASRQQTATQATGGHHETTGFNDDCLKDFVHTLRL